MRSIQTAGPVRKLARITRIDSRAVAQLNAGINIRGPGSRGPEMKRHRVKVQSIHSSGDPDERVHPVVNGAPQRRRSPVEGESIHVDVDEHGSYRAAWSGNWLGRSLGTNVRYRRASNLAGRNVSEA